MRCNGCGQLVQASKYVQHVEGEGQSGKHKLYTVNIAGVGPMIVPQTGGAPPSSQYGNPPVQPMPKMLDIPYLGRVTRNGFIIWTLLILLMGILLGLRG